MIVYIILGIAAVVMAAVGYLLARINAFVSGL